MEYLWNIKKKAAKYNTVLSLQLYECLQSGPDPRREFELFRLFVLVNSPLTLVILDLVSYM